MAEEYYCVTCEQVSGRYCVLMFGEVVCLDCDETLLGFVETL